jgi:tetratricopeptide (TPR) repeat protein
MQTTEPAHSERTVVLKAKYVVVIAAFALMFTNLDIEKILAQDKTPLSTAMEYLKAGSVYYLKNDFKNSIDPYSKALELERKQPSLPKPFWYVLVDNLGMSYGITGDLQKARETFEYGLSKDDKYPMFYYNLACTYAEMSDLDNTLKQLKLAFEYRQNMLAGEKFPDPATDDSFQRFMKNERFLTVLTEQKNAGK